MNDIIFLPMRLQPMHIGHLELLVEASKLGKKTKVLLFNYQFLDKNNPLTEPEKIKILKKTVELENLSNIEIISMPYYKNSKDRFDFVKKNIKLTKNSLVISGNKFILDSFSNLGYKVKTPKEVLGTLIDISGTKLRDLIKEEKEFRHHLASGTLHYLEELNFNKQN
jgi:nicotinamide mononucleotide adenylyltransferase